MERIAFLIKVKPEKIEEYKKIHESVWPDLLAELKTAGMRNYSLWMGPNGMEFGYLECDNWDAVCAYLEKSEVHTRWQEYMQDYLDTPAEGEGGQPIEMLKQSFMLE
jgi:L-rhamnose mutarotase